MAASPRGSSRNQYSPVIRQMPQLALGVPRFRLCTFRPPKVCWRGDACTFAHSDAELALWNRQKIDGKRLYSWNQGITNATGNRVQYDSEQRLSQQVQLQQQDSWPDPHAEFVPVPPWAKPHHQTKSTFMIRSKEPLRPEDLKQPISAVNYKEMFHKLLCWEEKEHITILHKRCDGIYPITIYEQDDSNSFGFLHVDDGDIVAYATQASEAVYLVKGEMEVRAKIQRDESYAFIGNRLYISMDNRFRLPHCLTDVEAQFEVKHSYFDGLHDAVNGLSDAVIRRLMPLEQDFDGTVRAEGIAALQYVPTEYFNTLHLHTLSMEKLKSYQVALTCKSGAPPVLVSGAFGTGKTCFLASIACCFIAEANVTRSPARILICAHHQDTANTILQTYFLPLLEHRRYPLETKVIRIVPNSHTSPRNRRIGQYIMSVYTFKQNWRNICQQRKVVIITTFLTSLQLKDLVYSGFLTHILIDEGAQAREPEAIAPLCLANRDTKIIIAGDPRQVGPSLLVLGEEARNYGLKASLLERLKFCYIAIGEKTQYLQTNLMENYRCHEHILKFASEMFYLSSVKHSAVTSNIKIPYGFPYPLVFICTSIKEVKNYSDCTNEAEADILMNMLSGHIKMGGVKRISVMSSSRAQVTLLRQKKLEHRMPPYVRVHPTFDIQGQEYDELYISTCEPTCFNGETRNPTKSTCDLYVFNTAITRARSLIVSFGNPYLLMSMEKHMDLKYKSGHCWSQYMRMCIHQNTLIIPNCVANPTDKPQLKKRILADIDSLLKQETPSCYGTPPQKAIPTCLQATSKDTAVHGVSNKPANIARDLVSAPAAKQIHQQVINKRVTSETLVKLDKGRVPIQPRKVAQISHSPTSKSRWKVPTPSSKATADSYQQDIPKREEKRPDMTDFPTLEETKNIQVSKRQRRSTSSSQQDAEVVTVGNTKYFVRYKDKLDEQIFQGPLTVENYKERFHHLLCWEEKEHMSILSHRCNGKYHVQFSKQRPGSRRYYHTQFHESEKYSFYGEITSDNEDALAYAKQAGEAATIIINGMKIKADFVASATLTVGFSHTYASSLKLLTSRGKIECDVMFELKHSYFNRQHEAIEALPNHVIPKLLPNERTRSIHPHRKKIPYCNFELDTSGQIQALAGILQQDTTPVIIAGPFGTGKTRVLARAAYELIKQNQGHIILICTHHQSSADTFIEHFQSLQEADRNFKRVKIVRIATAQYQSRVKMNNEHYYCGVKAVSFRAPQIIVSTLGLSHHLRIKNITHILIDEAAQTRETEAIIPLQRAQPHTKIVLAGDHCQVGPNVLVLGEEARRNGLCTSLLERLHDSFSEDQKRSCVFSLLQNYRSHSGLLMLPSALFYKSTLQCNVPDAKAHPLAPFPLVFVCSSIDDTNAANAIGTDENEADILVKMVEKYVYNSWPEEWGERCESPGKVCIMTPSATQKSLIVRKLRTQVKDRDEVVDVLKAYEIQGCEFTAVFLGTCETTDERGIPNNTTKTIMNRYVFNTALTRAKYLVLAVGNPLQILHREQKMYEIDPNNHSFMCWKEFIKRCIECKSLYLPNNVQADERKHFTELLHQRVFSGNERRGLENINYGDNDSILNAYKKKFEMIPECRRSKLKLSTVKGRLAWHINEPNIPKQSNKDSDDGDVGATDVHNCRLNVIYLSKAEAIPLDPSKSVVQIRGKGNMRGAFHGDIVEVTTFSQLECPDISQGNNKNNMQSNKGRVLRVVKRCHKQTILCRAHLYNPTLFYPVDKRYPTISNLPKLSKDLLEKKDKNMIDLELQSKDVVVFKPSSLTEDNIPEIENVIPFSLAQDMVFVIRILKWNPKFRFPLGAVIHAVPKSCSAFHAERILMIEHNVQYEDETDSEIAESQPETRPIMSHDVDARAFTIDPDEAMNLDDAISLWKKPDSYCLAVHIVNASKAITLNDEIDIEAAAKGQSIYGGKKVMNIIPLKKRVKLSLNPHKVCDVITISANVIISECSMEIKDIQHKESKIMSCVKLSYRTAQAIMDGEEYASDVNALSQCVEEYNSIRGQPDLRETLEILFKIAMKLRRERLGELAAQSYEVENSKEQECWQAHLLVEEMMIWANRHVAASILSAFPHCALLRRQAPPNVEKFEATRSAHCNIAHYSPALSKYLKNLPTQPRSLVIPLSTLHALQQAIIEGSEKILLNILTDDSCFPQLNASSTHFRRIQQRGEYIATTTDTDRELYHHHGLCVPVYTHFTSPLRRYADVVVQRMLKTLLMDKSCEYSHKYMQDLCHTLNGAAQNAKMFEKKMKALMLAVEYTQSSQQYEAVVTSRTKIEIEISFLSKELKVIPTKNKRFKVRHLQRGKATESELALYSWNVTMISFDETSSFPYDYEGISLNVGEALPHDWAAAHGVPYSTMTLLQETEKPDMLQEVTQYVTISPTATELSPAKWKYISDFIQHPSQEKFAKVRDILDELVTTRSKPAIPFQSQIKSPVVRGEITCRMDTYDLIKVWMTWSTREGILSPALQLIEIAPFFRICLQHNAQPAESFSDLNLSNASRKSYADLIEYVSLWEKVLLAEAAERSVRDNRTAIIYGANIDWRNSKLSIPDEIGASHYEPKGPIYLILPSAIIDRAKPFFKIGVGDMVCVRYGTMKNSKIQAVFHFVITCIEKYGTGERALLGSFGKENVTISEKMKPCVENEECEVQIIYMSKSYRRVYKVLLSLIDSKAQVSELLKVVAKGKEYNRLKRVPKTQLVNLVHMDRNPKVRHLWSSQKLLNPSQWNALKLSLTQRFLLIQGPPGTGKSETGAHIAYALAMSNRDRGHNECLFYSAPTNKAVDVVLRTLDCLSGELNILRVYGKAVERVDFQGSYCKNEAIDAPKSGYQCPEWARKYTLHWKIRHPQCNGSTELQQMEKMFADEYEQGHIAGAVMYSKWKKLIESLEATVMHAHFDIVLCTCNEAASERIRKGLMRQGLQKTRVLQCIVDESGMAYEPETIVPMRLCEHVILLGDHQQLQPVIEYKPARENGLTTSLFERYAKSRKTELLTIQYRMHEEICRFPSNHFYEGKIETDESVKQRSNYETKLKIWPNGFNMPIMFCDLVGKESLDGLSKSNPDEAEKAVQIVQVLTKVYNVKLTEIAVITPYKAQKKCLTELAKNAELSSLPIVTITESQGDEYGIVILSTVRSQPLHEINNEDYVQPDRSWLLENLGFLTDPHEMNVGITRSKYGLIIIGNKTLLQYDKNWKALITHYEERKCVIDGNCFPHRKDLEQV